MSISTPAIAPPKARHSAAAREGHLALKFAGASIAGFATDAALLHVLAAYDAELAWARVFSLLCAMQVTFALNRALVFRALDHDHLLHQWSRYMAAHGVGNLCNYWIFVTLVSTHWPIVANPLVALTASASIAWGINYIGARFIVFRRWRRKLNVAGRVLDQAGRPGGAK